MLLRECSFVGLLMKEYFFRANPLTPMVLWQVIAWEEENNER